jgi:2-polyprenyl-3-methyl-5-hydroxy-6-metoxy-1,4-benzoquinol methylase
MREFESEMAANMNCWDAVTPYHVTSAFYDHESFMKGKSTLNSIELELLGDVLGKEILHLQCHFGQDTISLQRMGASATGLDFSEKAITEARQCAQKLNLPVDFHCLNVYQLSENLNGRQFDIVFTSYGVLGWLPDLDRWAAQVSSALKPGGRLVLVEFHPVVWMMDYDLNTIAYDYFNSGSIHELQQGTYADPSAPVSKETFSWNHSLEDSIQSLITHGLQISQFREYNYSPYNCFRNMSEQEPGKFRITHLKHRIPMLFALEAFKPRQ